LKTFSNCSDEVKRVMKSMVADEVGRDGILEFPYALDSSFADRWTRIKTA
jgi:hypothetical protein